MSRFKPGDLVLIIGDPDCPPNIGKSGELAYTIDQESFVNSSGGISWFSAAGWCVRGDGLSVRTKNYIDGRFVNECFEHNNETFAEEKYLMPLRGDFEPETESELIEVMA